MKKHCLALSLGLALAALAVAAPANVTLAGGKHEALRQPLQRMIDSYLRTRAKPEHIAAVSLSISFANDPANLNLVAGRTSLAPGSAPITPKTLFQIGSITKSFTAAAILQLEAEGKLSIDQTVGYWLPQYPGWSGVSIRRLLDMTSGIPTYDDSPQMQTAMASSLKRWWEPAQLIAFVDPIYGSALKPVHGYSYSNTNYILSGLIIEAASGQSYESEISRRFFGQTLGLLDTYYSPHVYPKMVTESTVAGYFWNAGGGNASLKPFLGRDMRTSDMSWAGPAGGIVATPEDVTRWVRALFQGPLLAAKQRHEMESVVSLKNGRPIAHVSAQDPEGFGLGIAQATRPGIGTLWYYQGETLGYRMLYGYFPKDDLVIAIGVDSQPPDAENKVGALMENVYKAIKKQPASP